MTIKLANAETPSTKKMLVGKVISDKMNKTVVAEVELTFRNERIKKVMRSIKKYKVHDEHEQAQVGDIIEFYQGRPVAKTKFMYLQRVIKPAAHLEDVIV